MPCTTGMGDDVPPPDEKGYLEAMLCNACKILTAEQMQNIKLCSRFSPNLFSWYIRHIKEDAKPYIENDYFEHQRCVFYIAELKRLNLEMPEWHNVNSSAS